ncbi:MAG: ABC transporter ATP-binding protein [Ruminococcaceae bacterium]|nr:ABC transporter ATP-binding protein [Oscillospiraceae bacterium]
MATKKKKFNLRSEWKNNKDNIGWLFRQGKGFRRYVMGFLAINLVAMIVTLISSVAGKYVVDAATGFGQDVFWKYILLMFGATLFTIALSYVTTLFSSYVGEKFAFSIRAQMFDRVQRSKWMAVKKFHSSDMLSRLTGDVNTIAQSIISIVPSVVVAAVEFAIVLGILLYYDPYMAIIGLVVGPLGVVAGAVFRRKYVKYQKALRESESEYYSFIQESLANIPVTKSFQMEDANNEYFKKLRKRRLALVMKSSRLSALMHVVMKLIYNLGYVVAFSWCAYRLANPQDNYTYGTMTLFLSLVSILQSTIRSMGGIVPMLFTTIVAAKRLRMITDVESEDYSPAKNCPERVGIEFKDVSFTYEDERVLNNISLKIEAGRRVGIVGSSGAGKTTFIRLLLALIEPDSGEAVYFADGEKENITPASRRFVSYVPQGNTLLSGTIRSNLLVGNKDATEEQMWDALRAASAENFVKRTPKGLDTELTEKAGGLSEGQAQRIAIARAILRDKPVLILDEATSALDEVTEKKIFEKLCERKDRTCFIITHRRSMLQYCDVVFEISDSGDAVVIDKCPHKA